MVGGLISLLMGENYIVPRCGLFLVEISAQALRYFTAVYVLTYPTQFQVDRNRLHSNALNT